MFIIIKQKHLLLKKKCRNEYILKYWVKTPLLNRPRFDIGNNLLTELLTIVGDFQNFTRLPFEKFVELHEKVRNYN